ncbi:adenosine deaminase family protein [Microcoleus sp. FACHB-68]|uniref:adenosine deaminase family protein n=1 Tax=Microcoleus sp. FACHB-68 TaxID=2692826 RepID=UPI001F54B02A|nr:adenosine deaminase family protein [Microcoleus sp. FACHB-68]
MVELSQTGKTKNISNLSEMPKAELHIHLEGSPRWSSIREALHRHTNLNLPDFPPFYAPGFRFTKFAEFQDCFRRYIHPWLATPSGYAEVIRDVMDSLIQQKIRYAELNFDASVVERVGGNLEEVLHLLEAEVERAREQGTIIRMIVGIGRNQGVENAIYWVQKLLPFPIISGFDLHGDEAGWPADLFREAFAPVRESGKKIKVHSGEMVGPENIRAAVEGLGVTQIGHGTSAIKDPKVVELLIKHKVLVEMCPTSNERLQNVSAYDKHPILALDAAGVAVTVNSDDPSFFGVNLTDEMSRLISERDVTATELARWTRNAFNQAIVDEPTRTGLLAELEAWLQNPVKSEPPAS